MANFNEVWSKTKSFEGGYQAMPGDSGNYCPSKNSAGSKLIGTNYGISAIGYAQYKGSCPTVAEMKNLNETTARDVAKKNYWDKIQGDKIHSQAIAHLIFDFTYGGSDGPKQVREAINQIKGANTVKEYRSFDLSNKEIDLINSINEKQLFDKLTAIRAKWYTGSTYEEGLTNRLNQLKAMYNNALGKVSRHQTLAAAATLLIIGSVIFFVIKN